MNCTNCKILNVIDSNYCKNCGYILNISEHDCSICYNNENDSNNTILDVLPCGHNICIICLFNVIKCPQCRKNIDLSFIKSRKDKYPKLYLDYTKQLNNNNIENIYNSPITHNINSNIRYINVNSDIDDINRINNDSYNAIIGCIENVHISDSLFDYFDVGTPRNNDNVINQITFNIDRNEDSQILYDIDYYNRGWWHYLHELR